MANSDSSYRMPKAGEGNQLPRGLSLFRFVLFSGLMLGAAYAGLGLYLDHPPFPGHRPPGGVAAQDWEPSPWWLPSYLALRAGVGVQHAPQGYVYRGPLGRALYGGASVALGIVLGGVAGWIGGEKLRQVELRRRALGQKRLTA